MSAERRDATASHPDVDTLADYSEGLLDAAATSTVAEHLTACAECRDRLASFAAVSALLAELPDPVLPDDVAEQIDTALAGASGAGQVAGSAPLRRRWRMTPTTAGLAAAAAAVLFAGAIVVGITHGNGTSSNGTATSATGGSTVAVPRSTSGRDYDPQTLAAALPDLLHPGEQPRAADSARSGEAQLTAPQAGPNPAAAAPVPVPTELDRLRTAPGALDACVGALTKGEGPVSPVSVDFARFQGQPAAVIVLPTAGKPDRVDVWVVGPSCGPGQEDVRYFTRLPRPS